MTPRELDALVAEKVMGVEVSQPDGSSSGYLHIREWGEELPRYSSDIAAAWSVVEKLRGEEGFAIDLTSVGSPTSWDWNVHIEHPTDEAGYWLGTAKEAPRAICLAALRAKGVEVP